MPKKLPAKSVCQFLVIAVLLLAFSPYTYAAYLKDVAVSVTQPNGDILKCLASGDEFFNYLHDANGNIIIQHPTTGYYTYAQLDGQGKLIASSRVAANNGIFYDSNSVLIKPTPVNTMGIKVENIDFNVNIAIPSGVGSGAFIKVFIWNTDTFVPFRKAVVLSDSGVSE